MGQPRRYLRPMDLPASALLDDRDPELVSLMVAIDRRQTPWAHELDEQDRLLTYDRTLLEERYEELVLAAREAEDGVPFRLQDSRPAVRVGESDSFDTSLALARADGSFVDLLARHISRGPRLRPSALSSSIGNATAARPNPVV